MSNFFKNASKQVADVRTYLRESAGGNSLKYSAVKGERHFIYIPYVTQTVIDEATGTESIVKSINAISGNIHEWTSADGKYKATACMKGIVIKADDGTVLNDGSCPFCDRVTSAWDIYNHRKEVEEASCKLTGDARKQHLEKTFSSFRDERKQKEAKSYMYLLVVKFKTAPNGEPTLGSDGLPEYELKVMKLSSSRVEKIQQQIQNSGSELPGSELVFEYPNVDDRRLLVSQSTTTLIFPQNMLTVRYTDLVNKINNDVAQFDWEGIEKTFTEWEGMTVAEAEKITTSQFEQWDKYLAEIKSNPMAKYLEYVVETPATNPSLSGADGSVQSAGPIPTIPTIPNIPSIPNVPNVPNIPNVAPQAQVQYTGIQMPTVPNVEPSVHTPNLGGTAEAPVPNIAVPNVGNVHPTAESGSNPNAVFAGTGAAPSISV